MLLMNDKESSQSPLVDFSSECSADDESIELPVPVLPEKGRFDSDALESMSKEQLLEEVLKLQDSVETCCESLVKLSSNADLKVKKLELKVVELERKLQDEKAITTKLCVTNESLFREVQAEYEQARERKETEKIKRMTQLRKKELKTEKHLNFLLVARNQAVKQNTSLKRMLLQTCQECRQRLPLKKASQNGIQRQSSFQGNPMCSSSTLLSFDGSSASIMTPRVEPDPRPAWHLSSSTRNIVDRLSEEEEEEVPRKPTEVIVDNAYRNTSPIQDPRTCVNRLGRPPRSLDNSPVDSTTTVKNPLMEQKSSLSPHHSPELAHSRKTVEGSGRPPQSPTSISRSAQKPVPKPSPSIAPTLFIPHHPSSDEDNHNEGNEVIVERVPSPRPQCDDSAQSSDNETLRQQNRSLPVDSTTDTAKEPAEGDGNTRSAVRRKKRGKKASKQYNRRVQERQESVGELLDI